MFQKSYGKNENIVMNSVIDIYNLLECCKTKF